MKSKSNNEIDEAFKKIDEQFDKISKANAEELGYAQLKPIHEKFAYAQNGICALIAPVGSGKSYNYLKMMDKQEAIFDEPFFELIVICSTSSKFDKTVLTFKDTVKKSKIVPVKDVDLLDYLNEYMNRVFVYNAIMKFVMDGLPWNKIEKNYGELLDLLRERVGIYSFKSPKTLEKGLKWICSVLKDFGWKTYPHRMLLILDDFASHPLLRSKETEMSRLLKKLRHFLINVIIVVQTVKSIPKDIKRGLSDIILFPGISETDFKDLMKEINMNCIDHDTLWNTYKEIPNRHTTLTLHLIARRCIITNSSFKEK